MKTHSETKLVYLWSLLLLLLHSCAKDYRIKVVSKRNSKANTANKAKETKGSCVPDYYKLITKVPGKRMER